jgi:hypothetical protein
MKITDEEAQEVSDFAKSLFVECARRMQDRHFGASKMTYVFGAMLSQIWKNTKCDEETMRYNAELMIMGALGSMCFFEKDNEK